ncbi:hypothetical protein CCHOA_08515 [Corynebacterium choanae]|uniref:Uncharacterized protein n=1 Tax=Corynebacterium choanae TaxID=1862358 RepID=A0A3G6J8F4_9CORY|nr:hypothetical protein CCHOA_08515 [Corynebacterium choanae]
MHTICRRMFSVSIRPVSAVVSTFVRCPERDVAGGTCVGFHSVVLGILEDATGRQACVTGINPTKTPCDTSFAGYRKGLDVLFVGVFLGMRHAHRWFNPLLRGYGS